MRKIILIYGLIAGAIVSALMFMTMPFWENGTINFDNGELVGYTSMVIALSLVFFGVKSCRDQFYNGSITFWQAFKAGLLITLIASLMYALSWEIAHRTVAKGFTEKMTQHYIEKVKSEAKNEAELQAAMQEMENFKEWYKNPALRFGITLMEILPVGIVISLISALLLRRKEILPLTLL